MGPGSSREPPREEVVEAEAEGLEKTAEESRKEVGVSEEPMEELSRPKQLRLEEEPAEVEEVAAEAVAPEPAGEGSTGSLVTSWLRLLAARSAGCDASGAGPRLH
jgi:predicted Zn-dependent protease